MIRPLAEARRGVRRHGRVRLRRARDRGRRLDRGTAGTPRAAAGSRDALDDWVLLPENPTQIANWSLTSSLHRGDHRRHPHSSGSGGSSRSCPTLYLAAFVWENLLLANIVGADAADPARRAARGADERPAAGAVRDRARGDRVSDGDQPARADAASTKSFGGLQVISGLDLHVDEGEIVSVIGPNGAGKTTLFNLITGVYRPDTGDDPARRRRSSSALAPHKITELGIARTFQTLRLFLNMTRQGERHGGASTAARRRASSSRCCALPRRAARGEGDAARAEEKLAFFGQRLMGYRWDQPAYSLSYANRRRLEIARAMATQPRMLLLDEPAAGMNPVETHEITELIGKLRDDGGYTILVIEHDMHVVEGISDRVVALDHGVQDRRGLVRRQSRPTRASSRRISGCAAAETK